MSHSILAVTPFLERRNVPYSMPRCVVAVGREPEEIVVPYPDALRSAPRATECRSTLLIASLQAVTQRGRFDAYKAAIRPQALETITGAVAGVWLPIDIASAHYSACDTLGFTSQEQLDIGGEVIHKLQQTFLATVLKTARAAGTLSPWVGLPKFSAIFGRSFQGGGSQVVKLGPKDVRFDVVGVPLARINYFRVAYRGFVRAGSQLFTEKCFVNDVTKPGTKDTLSFRVSWV